MVIENPPLVSSTPAVTVGQWVKIALIGIALIGTSAGLSYLFQHAAKWVDIPSYELAWAAYLMVFMASFISNVTIFVPVPVGLSIAATAAGTWNPAMVALAAASGAALGELSGYFAGRMGEKVIMPEIMLLRFKKVVRHEQVERWVHKYGGWAIFMLAFQPVLPFDIGGLVAGAAKMPLRTFLPALWAGKFPKFLIFTYASAGIIAHIPFLAVPK